MWRVDARAWASDLDISRPSQNSLHLDKEGSASSPVSQFRTTVGDGGNRFIFCPLLTWHVLRYYVVPLLRGVFNVTADARKITKFFWEKKELLI